MTETISEFSFEHLNFENLSRFARLREAGKIVSDFEYSDFEHF